MDATGCKPCAANKRHTRDTPPGERRNANARGNADAVPRHASGARHNNQKSEEKEGRRRGPRRRGGRRAGGSSARTLTYGALDLGTNNCRLLVARPAPEGFRVVDAFSRIVRLGEGASSSGQLSEAAMSRTIDALKVCTSKLARRNVSRFRLVATEACRAAVNGAEFVERVQDCTGLQLEIVDRATEARLAVAGSAPLLAPESDGAIVFDIGGGSTELMQTRFREGSHRVSEFVSLPVGVVTLAERHGGILVDSDIFAKMVDDVRPALMDFASRIEALAPADHMLGTSGTVTTIAGVHQKLRRYDRSRVDGCWISSDNIGEVTEQLIGMSYEERAANPCIGSDRADLVLAGCAILAAILEVWPCEKVRVADRGLREGILTELMMEDGTFGRGPRQRRRGRKRNRYRKRRGEKPADAATGGGDGGSGSS